MTRDKLQDRTNDNYNAGATPFTLADFGLGGLGPDDFFPATSASARRSISTSLKSFFEANPSRSSFDSLVTAQNSVEQDFTADERVVAGYGMFGIDFGAGT